MDSPKVQEVAQMSTGVLGPPIGGVVSSHLDGVQLIVLVIRFYLLGEAGSVRVPEGLGEDSILGSRGVKGGSPWCDQPATHPSQSAREGWGTPLYGLCQRKAGPPAKPVPISRTRFISKRLRNDGKSDQPHKLCSRR